MSSKMNIQDLSQAAKINQKKSIKPCKNEFETLNLWHYFVKFKQFIIGAERRIYSARCFKCR